MAKTLILNRNIVSQNAFEFGSNISQIKVEILPQINMSITYKEKVLTKDVSIYTKRSELSEIIFEFWTFIWSYLKV
jgi:hypothetical protein